MSARIPRATYRLQFHRGFTLNDALQIVPYLASLGISHLYASPLLKARSGSTHGYDIVAYDELNPELGTTADFDELCDALRANDMGLLLDIVPNHMAVSADNEWWQDVLENGPSSRHAQFFDIDWKPAKPELAGRVLLASLGDHYGTILDQELLGLAWDPAARRLCATYHDARFPLDPGTYGHVLGLELQSLAATIEPPLMAEFSQLLDDFRRLPDRRHTDPDSCDRRARETGHLKSRLAQMLDSHRALRLHCERCIAAFTGSAHATRLHELLEQQAWRLAYWRTAADEVNYRRFFDVNELAGLRQEYPQVFAATHELVIEWVRKGQVDGLRIDHGDGLRDPEEYFRRLSEVIASPPIYTIAEKILGPDEQIPIQWAVHGTTGYDWLPWVNGIFTFAPAEQALTKILRRITGRQFDFSEETYRAKRLIMRTLLGSELTALATRLNRLSESDPHTRDYTLSALRESLADVAANFPVYRSYVTDRGASAADRAVIEWAIDRARSRGRGEDVSIYAFIRQVLLAEGFAAEPSFARREATAIAARFQQFTSPLMAKGMEDTTFYRYHLLAAVNEVGADPRRFSVSLQAFHAENARRARDWPHSMLATSTHDTKRSEDARLRLCVMSEFAAEWRGLVFRWSKINRPARGSLREDGWPDRAGEYLFFQSALAIWPVTDNPALPAGQMRELRERLQAYMCKALREAKLQTSWVNPNTSYEKRFFDYVETVMPEDGNEFTRSMSAFAKRLALPSLCATLCQQLLKLTCPGVPDLYQGTELIDLSLVDPDNRRPVDFDLRRRILSEIISAPARALDLNDVTVGSAKLAVTLRTLQLRSEQPELFEKGAYIPIRTGGKNAHHLLSFAREYKGRFAITVTSRWHATLMRAMDCSAMSPKIWADDTHLEIPRELCGSDVPLVDRLSGRRPQIRLNEASRVCIADLLGDLPCALLTP